MDVLLVTTNPRISADVRAALDAETTEIHEVRTPQRALQQLDDEGPFDVVVVDNDTAPTGGLFVCREMTARKEWGADLPPIVLLLARDQDRWLARWGQPDVTILKPVDPFDLYEVVQSLVEGTPVPAFPGVHVTEPGLPPEIAELDEGVQVGSILSGGRP